MLLRNKKTGEIKEAADVIIENMNKNGSTLSAISIDEIKEEWEDYGELKRVYFIDTQNGNVDYFELYSNYICDVDFNSKIGNYFGTREEAERAVEKLKAWKRLKDKGIKFNLDFVKNNINFTYRVDGTLHSSAEEMRIIFNDLKLLFGGEDE